MKKSLIKIDRFILNQLTEYVKRWIKKNDYKKHKIDFTIQLQKVELCLVFAFALLIPVMFYIIQGHFLTGGIHLLAWSVSVGINFWRLQRTTHQEKPLYDVLFSMRKNPAVYEMEKQVLEIVFIKTRKSRMAAVSGIFFIYWFVAGMLGLLYFVVLVPQLAYISIMVFFLISPFLSGIETYLFCVFDFDEPEEKKKVVKESISEIVLKSWQQLIGGLSPQPNYGN